jgi:hypothetical protein
VKRVVALLLLIAGTAGAQEVRYQAKITNVNRVGLTVTNYGFFGNNFNSRSPSMEYPLGEGLEHLSRAGLWIGARAISDTGEVLRVSQGAIDNSQGSNQLADVEYTPLPQPMLERSRIRTSRSYSPDAVSDQDFVAYYSDRPGRPGSTYSSENHVPLGVNVKLSSYAFGLDAAADFVVLHFEITNDGPPLRDVFVGLYSQLVSGDKSAYPSWPPSGSAPAGSWYYKKYFTWVDSLTMVAEHYCVGTDAQGNPDPVTCNFQVAPAWAASKFLGVRAGPGTLPEPDSLRVAARFWNYLPGDSTRDEDVERYALMAKRGIDTSTGLLPGQGPNLSPIELITVGPFPEIPPDSTIAVDFAFVGGRDFDALNQHAAFAQFAFEQNYLLPAPPPAPRLHARAKDTSIELLWDAAPEFASDPTSPAPGGIDFEGYRIYAGTNRNALSLVQQFDLADTTGFNTGFDAIRMAQPIIENGDTLVYRAVIPAQRDGFKTYVAVASYDTGDEQIPSLESGINENKTLAVPNPGPGERSGVTVYPNPYKAEATWDAGRLVRDHYLWFVNLPVRSRIKIYTLSGDLVYDTDFDGASYTGANARGLYDPTQDIDTGAPVLSGASFAWNLITRSGQAAASGLYIWTVENRDTGKAERGKFLVVKSDVEGFR